MDALRPGADQLAARTDGDLPGASLQGTASASTTTTSALSDLSAALCETGGGSSSSSSSNPGLQGDLNAALFGMCVNSGLRDASWAALTDLHARGAMCGTTTTNQMDVLRPHTGSLARNRINTHTHTHTHVIFSV